MIPLRESLRLALAARAGAFGSAAAFEAACGLAACGELTPRQARGVDLAAAAAGADASCCAMRREQNTLTQERFAAVRPLTQRASTAQPHSQQH
jgi:hypothetical protein